MPLTPEEIEQLRNRAFLPKQTQNDSGSMTMPTPQESKEFLDIASEQEATVSQKPPVKFYKLRPPGSV